MPLLDNNIAETQTANAAYAASNPGVFGVTRYTSPPNGGAPSVPPGGQQNNVSPASPSASPIQSLSDFAAQRGSTQTGPVDENQIRSQVAQQYQSTIDAIDAQYADLVNQQQQTNENNSGKTRAVVARSGTLGSDFGNAAQSNQETANNQAIKALRDEQATKIAAAQGTINKAAQDEIAAKKAEALGNADAYSKYLSDQQTKAQGQLTSLGQSGTTVGDLQSQSPETLDYLKKALGMTDFQIQQALSTAAGDKLKTDTKIVGDTAYASVYNPITGKFETHVQQFDVPSGSLVDFGNGNIMVKSVGPDGKVVYTDASPAKPVDVSNGGTLVDPKTGQVIYQAPYRSAAGGGGPASPYVPGQDQLADSWVAAVKNGNATMAQVPAQYKNTVAQGLNSNSAIVDPSTDAQVRAIIAANPGEYGKAADAIDKAFGAGTATKYDAQLKAVYNNKQDVASAFNSQSFSPLASSRFATASNKIAANFINLPQYQLTANGLPYLQRIQAAIQTPGAISDQELLDSITKLSTSGNAVTDAQINTITGGQSYKDKISVFQNKFKNGGVLSDAQRQDLVKTATDIYNAYQKGYQPVYDKVTSQLTQAGIPQAFWTIPDLNTLSENNTGSSSGTTSGKTSSGIQYSIQP